jgi:hypothetical protein
VDGPLCCGKSWSSGFTGICGELWLAFGFSGVLVVYFPDFSGIRAFGSSFFYQKYLDALWWGRGPFVVLRWLFFSSRLVGSGGRCALG